MKDSLNITTELLNLDEQEAIEFKNCKSAYSRLHPIHEEWRVTDCTGHLYDAKYLNFHETKEAALEEFRAFITPTLELLEEVSND